MEEKKIRKFQVNPNFLKREIGGESVLVPIGDAGMFENSVLSLNRSCSFLWDAFQKPITVDEVIAKTLEHFEGDQNEIIGGVLSFVNDYLRADLLREVE